MEQMTEVVLRGVTEILGLGSLHVNVDLRNAYQVPFCLSPDHKINIFYALYITDKKIYSYMFIQQLAQKLTKEQFKHTPFECK